MLFLVIFVQKKKQNNVKIGKHFINNFDNIYFDGKSSEHSFIDTETLKDTWKR